MTLLDLSLKIDPACRELLSTVAGVAVAQGLDFFVIGATARDMILCHGYGIEPGRATVDIDIAVMLADWQEFERLIAVLLSSGSFFRTSATQRLRYCSGLPLDIVPFGALAREEEIRWPPDGSIVMNVRGFAEAYAQAMPVCLQRNPEVKIKFASPAGWALLKLLAWQERGAAASKDAQDLRILLRHYAEAGNEDRLYGEEADLLTAEQFDLPLAGARLLGHDLAKLCLPASRAVVREILARETEEQGHYKLVTAMVREQFDRGSAFEEAMGLLTRLKMGFDREEAVTGVSLKVSAK